MVASSEKKNQALKKDCRKVLLKIQIRLLKTNKVDLENGEKNGMAKYHA